MFSIDYLLQLNVIRFLMIFIFNLNFEFMYCTKQTCRLPAFPILRCGDQLKQGIYKVSRQTSHDHVIPLRNTVFTGIGSWQPDERLQTLKLWSSFLVNHWSASQSFLVACSIFFSFNWWEKLSGGLAIAACYCSISKEDHHSIRALLTCDVTTKVFQIWWDSHSHVTESEWWTETLWL